MAFDLLNCGVFCWGTDYRTTETLSYNYSAQYTFGMLFFFTSLIFLFGITGLLVMLHLQVYYKGDLFIDSNDQQEFTHKRFSSKGSAKRVTLASNPSLANNEQEEIKEAFNPSWVKQGPVDDSRKGVKYYVLMILVFGGLFPFIIISCMSLPTWWAYFTPYDIQTYRSVLPQQYINSVYTGYDDDDNDGGVNANINKANSFWWWDVSKNPQSHDYVFLFPDIVMYYGLIYLIVMIALLSEVFPELRVFLLRKCQLGPSIRLCVGEILLATFLALFLGSYYPYWFLDHVWEQGYIAPEVIPVEDGARSMGQTANVVCGLLILPVSRNSIWSLVFGVSYESLIVYHKCIAVVFFIVVTLHMVLVWRVYYTKHTWPKDVLSVPTRYHSTDFTIPSASISYFIMVICMGACATEIVRRRHHEIFWFAHRFSIILFLIVLWHATMSWYYVAVGIILYTVDHVIRFSRVVGTTIILEQASVIDASDSSVSYLAYKACETSISAYGRKQSLKYEMGQYFFINIPELSILEWHPFSISSAPSDSYITHHIKMMGTNQWTGKLAKYIKQIEKSDSKKALKRVVMNIDGPYGSPLRASQYNGILFVAGGIGITPIHSCFRHIYKTLTENPSAYPGLVKVRLLWMTRKNDRFLDFTWNMVLADNLMNKEGKQIFSVAKYITSESKEAAIDRGSSPIHTQQLGSYNVYDQSEIHFGRASFDKEISEFSEGCNKTLVYACGPKMMIETVHDICMKLSCSNSEIIEFREDLFAL